MRSKKRAKMKKKSLLLTLLAASSIVMAGCQDNTIQGSSSSIEGGSSLPSSSVSSSGTSSSSSLSSSSSSSSASSNSSDSSSSASSSTSSSSSSSSSSSLPEVEKYGVTLVAGEGLTLSADKEEAAEGDTVTITVSVLTDYAFVSLTSEDVTIDEITAGSKYSFQMPGKAVTITGKAELIVYEVRSVKNMSSSVTKINGLSDGEKIRVGQTVEFSLEGGYQSGELHVFVNGVESPLTWNAETSTWDGSFLVGKADVDFVVTDRFEKAAEEGESSYTFTYNANDALYKVYGAKSGDLFKLVQYGSSTLPRLYISYEKGTYIKGIKAIIDGNEESPKDVLSSSYYYTRGNGFLSITGLGSLLGYSTIKTSVELKIEAEKVETRNIAWTPTDAVTLEGNYQNVTPGDQVNIVAKGVGENIVTALKEVTLSDSTITNFKKPTLNADGSLSFVMPNCDLSFEFEVAKARILPTLDPLPEGVASIVYKVKEEWSYKEAEKATPGTTVYLGVNPAEGYEISKVNLPGVELKDEPYGSWNGYRYSFTLPSEEEVPSLSIEVEVLKLRKVTFEESEAYSVSVGKETYKKGDEVTLKIKEKVGYKINAVKTDDPSIVPTLAEGSFTNYSFTMPDKDVKLVIETEARTPVTISATGKEGAKDLKIYNKYDDLVTLDTAINPGEPYRLKFSDNVGYKFQKLSLSSDPETALVKDESGYYNFVAPTADFSLDFNFLVSAKHSFTLTGDAEKTKLDVVYMPSYTYLDSGETSVFEGEKVCFRFTRTDSKYRFVAENFSVKGADGTDIEFKPDISDSSAWITFTVPSQDFVVNVAMAEIVPTKIQKELTGSDQLTADMMKVVLKHGGEEIAEALPGDRVIIELNVTNEFFKTGSFVLHFIDAKTAGTANEVEPNKSYSFYSSTDYAFYTMTSTAILFRLVYTPKA